MVFALEEINQNPNLLPGISLGYHIRDSCALHPWATQAALSLVGGDSTSCNSAAPPEIRERRGNKPCIHLHLMGIFSPLITTEGNAYSINTVVLCLKQNQELFSYNKLIYFL